MRRHIIFETAAPMMITVDKIVVSIMLIRITSHDSMLMVRIRVSRDYENRRCIPYLNNPTIGAETRSELGR